VLESTLTIAVLVIGVISTAAFGAENQSLDRYVAARVGEFDQIPSERRDAFAKLTAYVQKQLDSQKTVRMTFICTHNSRRSQMAQLWAAVAADHYKVGRVETFSGGTESTAFNPRAVAALDRAGIAIRRNGGATQNPHYEVQVGATPIICFSKVYNESPNPKADFVAVMTCSEADKKCPNVAGAEERIAVPYNDPKESDGTATESSTYDERCAQIARELLFVFSGVRHGN
jgi:protein-tyrosine-phosphatase